MIWNKTLCIFISSFFLAVSTFYIYKLYFLLKLILWFNDISHFISCKISLISFSTEYYVLFNILIIFTGQITRAIYIRLGLEVKIQLWTCFMHEYCEELDKFNYCMSCYKPNGLGYYISIPFYLKSTLNISFAIGLCFQIRTDILIYLPFQEWSKWPQFHKIFFPNLSLLPVRLLIIMVTMTLQGIRFKNLHVLLKYTLVLSTGFEVLNISSF